MRIRAGAFNVKTITHLSHRDEAAIGTPRQRYTQVVDRAAVFLATLRVQGHILREHTHDSHTSCIAAAVGMEQAGGGGVKHSCNKQLR